MKLKKQLEEASRFMSLVLRHKPEKLHLVLDENGFVESELLCSRLNITAEELELIVVNNDKQRFAFNEDKSKIRASQGHSVKTIDLELKEEIPPQQLYHGTKDEFLKSIMKDGLLKQKRQHVHLSDNIGTAMNVANRRNGISRILTIQAMEMRADGYKFYKSANGVWLTDNVPPKYING
jgi:putative RNA 2'-phosphotransferase